METVRINGAEINGRNRAASVLRIARETRKDLLEYIESLEDHEGNLDIHCYENTSSNIKSEILEFFTKVWELHNEYTVWIHPPIYKNIWVNVYRAMFSEKIIVGQPSYSTKESAITHKNLGIYKACKYIKTIEITDEL